MEPCFTHMFHYTVLYNRRTLRVIFQYVRVRIVIEKDLTILNDLLGRKNAYFPPIVTLCRYCIVEAKLMVGVQSLRGQLQTSFFIYNCPLALENLPLCQTALFKLVSWWAYMWFSVCYYNGNRAQVTRANIVIAFFHSL